MKDSFYSNIVQQVYAQARRERMYFKKKDTAIKDPILQRTNDYIPPKPKSNLLLQKYSINIKPKSNKPIKTFHEQKRSAIIYSDKSGREEIQNKMYTIKNKSKFRNNFTIKHSRPKSSGIRVFPQLNRESSVQYLFTSNTLNEKDENSIVINKEEGSKLKRTKSSTSFGTCKPMHDTFARVFLRNKCECGSCGDVATKYNYKATKYKKAKYDNLNDLIICQSLIKENKHVKDKEIPLKPNNVSYSYMIKQNKINWYKRVNSDYY